MSSADRQRSGRALSLRLALLALLFYTCVIMIKASMFACSWASQPSFAGLSFKTCLALAQTFGYAAGKVPSMIYSPKLPQSRLRGALIAVVVAAGSCVCLSCITPPAISLALVALCCACLAPVWSVLQRFLEGRQDTELILAVVSFSYIGGSGLVKGIAVDLLALGLTDPQATAVCAALGGGIGVAAAVGVAAQPSPSAADVEKRGRRKEMTSYRAECGKLTSEFGLGSALSGI